MDARARHNFLQLTDSTLLVHCRDSHPRIDSLEQPNYLRLRAVAWDASCNGDCGLLHYL
jgi:hypothetical protein